MGKILIKMDKVPPPVDYEAAALVGSLVPDASDGPANAPKRETHVVVGELSPFSLSLAASLARESMAAVASRGRITLIAYPSSGDGAGGVSSSLPPIIPGVTLVLLKGTEGIESALSSLPVAGSNRETMASGSSLSPLMIWHDSLSGAPQEAIFTANVVHRFALELGPCNGIGALVSLCSPIGGLLSALLPCPPTMRAAAELRGDIETQAAMRIKLGLPAACGLVASVCKPYVAARSAPSGGGGLADGMPMEAWSGSPRGVEASLSQIMMSRCHVGSVVRQVRRLVLDRELSLPLQGGYTFGVPKARGFQTGSLPPIYRALLDSPVSGAYDSHLLQAQLEATVVGFIAAHSGIPKSSVDLTRSMSDYGLDSLALIGLASQLRVLAPEASVMDVMEDGSIESFIKGLAGGGNHTAAPVEPNPAGSDKASDKADDALPGGGTLRPRVLVLHGFRTNTEIIEMQMHSVCSAWREIGLNIEPVYLEAPHQASGPGDPLLPHEMKLKEWWGEREGPLGCDSYMAGWQGPRCDGLMESIRIAESFIGAKGPFEGVIGFSQGAALATILLARGGNGLRFGLLFSGVTVPRGSLPAAGPDSPLPLELPSLHVFDPNEHFVKECHQLQASFSAAETLHHAEDHTVPSAPQVCGAVAAWLGSVCR